MTSKEKKRVRWAETDDIFDEASIRAEKVPRLADESDGPAAARDEAGAVPEHQTVLIVHHSHVEYNCVMHGCRRLR